MDNIDLDIEALRKAKESLQKSYSVYQEGNDEPEMCSIYADSCVKRFEYTFETAWKTMKKYFKLQYSKKEEELTMNNIFRYMESYGFAQSWLRWKEYYRQRNNTSHEYNIEKSRELLKIIPDFLIDVDFLLKKWNSI